MCIAKFFTWLLTKPEWIESRNFAYDPVTSGTPLIIKHVI